MCKLFLLREKYGERSWYCLILVAILVVYTCIGALVFLQIEGDYTNIILIYFKNTLAIDLIGKA